MIDEGLRPALLVATPVGFCECGRIERKSPNTFSALYHLRWDKRRTPVAVAIVNDLWNPIQERDLGENLNIS